MKTHSNFAGIWLLCCLLLGSTITAQTFGPNSPGSGVNNTSVGTNAWTLPGNVNASDNAYASITAKGITNYISASSYGFSIPITTTITGIQLEVEKATLSPTVVTVLNNWTPGGTKVISASGSRCLLAMISNENGMGARDVTSLTYGTQAMTKLSEAVVGTAGGFQGKLEIWYLLEAGIAAAASTSFVINFSSPALLENVDYIASAAFTGVDQLVPFSGVTSTTINAATVPITLSPTLAGTAGGIMVAAVHCGNNATPAASIGGTNTYGINSGFTEVVDTYTANASASTSGMCLEVSNKSIITAGAEGPAATFAGTPNRQIIMCVNMQCLRELDNSVRLVKSGTITGNNYALTTTPWLTTDSYVSYGSSSDLWGTTWSALNIDATNFGAVISASVNNGTARVDHMRITVTSSSTLPVELVDFSGARQEQHCNLQWHTATEHHNKQFDVERSDGTSDFKSIGTLPGKGNSTLFCSYMFTDENPLTGNNYYRLKQTDTDGQFEYSKIIVVNTSGSDGQEISVYPNPSYDGSFTIASQQVMSDGVFIYSAEMKLIKKIEQNNSTLLNLSINELTDGVYYLVYSFNGGQKIKQIQKYCR